MGDSAAHRTAASRKARVFISRTTAGLKGLAEEIGEILRERGVEPVVQTEFLPDWRSVPQMLQDKLIQCDCVIAIIGPVHGGEPEQEPARLKDPRTHGRRFSFTQWEYLVARDLRRPLFIFLVSGPELVTPFDPEDPILMQRQQLFIEDFPKDRQTLFYEYNGRERLLDHIRTMDLPLTAVAGKPTNIPYASLGTLFKGREDFLAQLRTQLTTAAATVIKGHRAIHGMGGVGKTRAAIEYAWQHADHYNALLFVTADSPSALQRNLASLCGPLVLNLPEQDERDVHQQFEAVLRWLELHPGWFLIIDNVDTEDAAVETSALLERLSQGHVVITSRISDWSGQVQSLDLDVLSTAASIEFLDERTTERRIRQDDDDEQVQKLVEILDCLALALEQAGAQISYQRISYADYIALWEAKRPVALAWHDEATMHYPRSLAITYETSVAQLSPGARELFRTLAWFAPDPIPRRLLDSRPHPDDERRHFGEIERLHLARFQTDGKSFTVHRLNQEITRQQQGDPQPALLVGALEWVKAEYVGEPDNVRDWPTLVPLTPHAETVATSGADRGLHSPTTRLLSHAGVLRHTQAEYGRAEPLLRRALAIQEQVSGAEHPDVAATLNNLARLLREVSRLGEAESLLRRALAIDEQSFGAEQPEVAAHLNNLGLLLKDTNRLGEAEPLMRRALMIDEQSYGSEHPIVATRLSNLAQLLQDTNRLADAEPMMRRALAIDEQSYGAEHPKVATDLNNLAQLLQETNRLAEAEPLMRRALMIDEQSYGSEHPIVATRLSNLAQLLQDTNRLADAEPMMRRALAIDKRVYGATHPKVAICYNSLAQLLQDTNRLADAETLLRRALAIDEQSYGAEHPRVATDLNNLAQLLQETNRLAEAEPLMRRALAIDEQSYGAEHPHVARDLNNLAQLFLATSRLEEAEPLLCRALAIDEQSYGAEHTRVALRLNNLAGFLQATNRLEEAEPLLRRALAIDEQSYGADHPRVARNLNNLAQLLQETSRLEEAEPLMRRALAIDEQSYGANHTKVAIRLNNLARLLQATKCLVEAEPLMRRSLDIFNSSLGTDHPNTQSVQRNYDLLLWDVVAKADHAYLQRRLLRRQQQTAIQSEDFELAGKCRDEMAALQDEGDLGHFDTELLKLLDRVFDLGCLAFPVKQAIGGRLISTERQVWGEDVEAELQYLEPGIAAVEDHFAEFPYDPFRDLCERLQAIRDRGELFSALGITALAQKQNLSVSTEAWLAYAISGELDGSSILYCIANRWAQLPPSKEEAFQVADIFDRHGYSGEAANLRARFSDGEF